MAPEYGKAMPKLFTVHSSYVGSQDPNHGAVASGSLSDEIDVLSNEEQQECEQALVGESIEYHREKHLKRALLARIVSQVCMIWFQ